VAEQVALIYTGINGYLDDLEVGAVKKYCTSFIRYLATSNNKYIQLVSSTNQFTDEAEDSLKQAIADSKKAFAN
jgi:F-type H+-transporting ATPase subunit alpha